MPGSVIIAGARTPIGKLSGALGGFSAMDLGGFAIAAALERAGVSPDAVDYVFMGQVLLAGAGQITARQAAAKAGIPLTVPATTVNKAAQGFPAFGDLQFFASTTNDGFYRTLVVSHVGDSRGTEWYTKLVCLNLDPSAAPGKSVPLT